MKRPFLIVACAGAAVIVAGDVQAAVSYDTIGAPYSQNFDSLPSAPTNTNLQVISTNNTSRKWWMDDATPTDDGDPNTLDTISIPGWYLNHPIDTSAGEGGSNGNQRFRIGSGSSGSGSFYSFGANNTTDRALGDIGATTLATNGDSLRIGLRLTNNTGVTLNEFTLTYDGEQYRDGESATPELMNFSYMTTGTDENNWHSAGASNPATFVPQLAFTAPQSAGTNVTVDGNSAAGRVAGITHTVTGMNWAPGTDLWLRWSDPQLASADDDGLAIDNVVFTAAVPEPTGSAVLALGAAGVLVGRRRR